MLKAVDGSLARLMKVLPMAAPRALEIRKSMGRFAKTSVFVTANVSEGIQERKAHARRIQSPRSDISLLICLPWCVEATRYGLRQADQQEAPIIGIL